MSFAIDERKDLRNVTQDSKRFRDATTKWSRGTRVSSGCSLDWYTMDAVGGSESQREKVRPRGKNSEGPHLKKCNQNFTKGRPSWDTPHRRVQTVAQVRDELNDPTNMSKSMIALGAPYRQRKLSLSESFTYSFDKVESPNRPQSLDIFVKTTRTGEETERLVQREYEILDTNGEALRGKRARQDLRKSGPEPGVTTFEDEDGFEIV